MQALEPNVAMTMKMKAGREAFRRTDVGRFAMIVSWGAARRVMRRAGREQVGGWFRGVYPQVGKGRQARADFPVPWTRQTGLSVTGIQPCP
jgi:hypothetical protein